MNIEEMLAIIPIAMQTAIKKFNKHEMYLISCDVNERTVSSKFGHYLADELQKQGIRGYDVDAEYNRDGDDIKCIGGANAIPDLIVHKRGRHMLRDGSNLICIEMKKTSNPQGFEEDVRRLKMFVEEVPFCYMIGYMIEINVNYGLKIARKVAFNLSTNQIEFE